MISKKMVIPDRCNTIEYHGWAKLIEKYPVRTYKILDSAFYFTQQECSPKERRSYLGVVEELVPIDDEGNFMIPAINNRVDIEIKYPIFHKIKNLF